MKKLITIFAATFLLLAAIPAAAQLKFGVKAGANISHLSLSKEVYSSQNIAGFTGGIMGEFTLPVLGLGVDASVLYSRKGAKLGATTALNGLEVKTQNLDYIDIPVNLKWKLNIPFVKPFLAVGPNFSFLVSNNNLGNFIKNAKDKTFDLGINVGGGIELFSKIQIAAQYCWGLTDAMSIENPISKEKINVQNRYWTITAAYLF